jgi:pSer/pThr/pTyr-binding forkhead associated (FHA) protein
VEDTCLNSPHLWFLPRRQEFWRTREVLRRSRGWLPEATERVQGLQGEADAGQARSRGRQDQVLSGTGFLLTNYRTGSSYPLKIGLNTIGRLPENDIVLDDMVISRRHCVLLMNAGGVCELHDTASRNGTFVNGCLIRQPVPLTPGDWILVATRLLRFIGEKD